ncbi:DUF6495 family protein [Psychroflexus sp. MES1-P1E]|uniref:DUF6495 family protein n=1 Tax=Psychroflexus sp. MES1-P1E TaxID=2058320 RepID=UPI000C7CEFDC|nr:DUF6495 family protein [Psychroflexus sp. MES1-P1E]PKG43157.1 hypothetical protein CXF67_06625 [Psychroflexus sp. MES1-P1E]
MKYERLTQEQLKEMNKEFINFLASQSITNEEWEDIKTNKPQVAEDELDVFSDLVWEGVLNNVNYLEHFSPQQLFLFEFTDQHIDLIGIKIQNETVDINTKQGFQWLRDSLLNEDVNIYTSRKALSEDRNKDIFALIKQGAHITKGKLYQYFSGMVEK